MAPSTKRGSLFATPAKPAAPAAPEPAVADAPARQPLAKSRQGKRTVTAYLDPEAFRQLKRLAVDEDTAIQELLVEGINAVFDKRGLSRIA